MDRFRKFLPAISAGLLLILLVLFGFNHFREEAFVINAEDVSIFEEDSTYYLKKAAKNIAFEVKVTDSSENLTFTLVDENEQPVDVRVKENGENTYTIRAPRSGYTEGKRYKLTLGSDVFFTDEHLKPTNTLVFVVERDPIEHYKFTDSVIEVEETIVETEEDIIQVKNFKGQPDDIIFGMNQDGEEAIYKIIEVQADGSFLVEYPALDEIYAELEVHGEYELDFNDAVSNPELEAEIVKNIEKSPFYSSLVKKAYSAEDQKNIETQLEIIQDPKTKDLQFKIIFTLKPGEDGLFNLMEFKEHEVKLTLVSEVGATVDVDIQEILEWDIAATRTENFEWMMDIDVVAEKEGSSKLKEILSVDDEEAIEEVVNVLNEITSDEADSTVELFSYSYAVKHVPGLFIGTDIHLALNFELSANLQFGNGYATKSTMGLRFLDQKFTAYSSVDYEEGLGRISLKGRFDSQAGLNFDFYTMFFHEKIAHFSVQPEVGLYAEGYAGYTLLSDSTVDKAVEDRAHGYFEPGMYYNGTVEGHLKTLLNSYDYLHEIEEQRFHFEKLTFGDYKIILGIKWDGTMSYMNNGRTTPPDFTLEYYDVRSGEYLSEPLDFDDLSFSIFSSGKKLKKKEGRILIPERDLPDYYSDEIKIIAQYEYSDKQNFETNFTVRLRPDMIDHEDFDNPTEFSFLSGAGAWATSLSLSKDGSFEGVYSDTDAGASGPGYLATVYVSNFTGQFENIEKINDEMYSMDLLDYSLEKEPGEEWIEDEILYVASDPYGLADGKKFDLYAPGTLTNGLSEEFISWLGGHTREYLDQLTMWGLHNINTGNGFFSEESFDLTVSNETNKDQDFAGIWHEVSPTVHAQPVSWIIEKEGDMYSIDTELAGGHDDRLEYYQMTAKLINENGVPKLYSDDATVYFRVFDTFDDIYNYVAGDADVEYTIEVVHENEVVEFFFEDGYLQSYSSIYGDHRYTYPDGVFKGYERVD